MSRERHVPVLIHVQELTQPQGHSTSGSHERYKSPERLDWESKHDCNLKMRQWIIEQNIASDKALSDLETDIKKKVKEGKNKAWKSYLTLHLQERDQLIALATPLGTKSIKPHEFNALITEIKSNREPLRRDIVACSRKIQWLLRHQPISEKKNFNLKGFSGWSWRARMSCD